MKTAGAAIVVMAAFFGTGVVRAQEPATTAEPPAAPGAAPPDSPPASSGMSEADLAALGVTGAGAAPAADASSETPINIYGFVDFMYSQRVMKKSNPWTILNRYNSFSVGNINVYFTKNLSDRCRALLETRFLYLPHGAAAAPGSMPATIDTTVGDPADFGRPLNWGGVEIERVQAECDLFDGLTLRAGQWLTPYGIWNVDHGTPTIISIRRPFVIGEALFPERQTGLMLFGKTYVRDIGVTYVAALSNGRGPLDAYRDYDDNKAFTGRVELQHSGLADVRAGGSYYRGIYTDRKLNLDQAAGTTTSTTNERYEEQAVGADLQVDFHGALLRSEYIYSERAYRPGGRPETSLGNRRADSDRHGLYAMGGYHLPWNVTPFVMFQNYKWAEGPGQVTLKAWGLNGGLNVQVIPSVILKAEYMYAKIDTSIQALTETPYQALEFQGAWVF